MKFSCSSHELATAVQLVSRQISTKPELPVLGGIHCQVSSEGTITLSATNLSSGIQVQFAGQTTQSGIAVIPGKIWQEISRRFPIGEVRVELAGTQVKIKAGKVAANLPVLTADDFPAFPEVKALEWRVPTEIVAQSTTLVGFAASKDVTRVVLTSVKWEFTDTTWRSVTTDGFRLSLLDVQTSVPAELVGKDLLLPSSAVSEVVKTAQELKQTEIVWHIDMDLKQAIVLIGQVKLYVRLLEGDFPPYQKILPSQTAISGQLDRLELLENVKTAHIFAREASHIIKLAIEKDEVLLSASGAQGAVESTLVFKNTTGESAKIAFNGQYLIELLQAVDVETLTFGINDALKPALFQSDSLPGFLHVVMPFRVTDSE